MKRIYLDHQAATPLLPEAFEAMRPFLLEEYGNPSSFHALGLRARQALAKARAQFAAMINAESPEQIVFTSSGTEAINLALKGAAYASQSRGNHIVLSAIEHPAVLQSVAFLESQGFTSTKIEVDGRGLVDPDAVRKALTRATILIAVHHANHEIGTVEPIGEIAAVAGELGIPLFVDATASGGWLPIDVRALGASMLALSPHRFYGPKGVGVLYRRRTVPLTRVSHGGDQESGLRPGTENVAAIVGAGAAAEAASIELQSRMAHTAELQERLWTSLRSEIDQVRCNGPEPGPARLGINLSISVAGVEGEGLVLALDLQGIAAASGSACMSRSPRMSHVLAAIGLDPEWAKGTLLFSLGKDNTAEEIESAAHTLGRLVTKHRALFPDWG